MEKKIKPIKWTDFKYAVEQIIKHTDFNDDNDFYLMDDRAQLRFCGYIHGMQIKIGVESNICGFLVIWVRPDNMHIGLGNKYFSGRFDDKYNPHTTKSTGMIKELWTDYRILLEVLWENREKPLKPIIYLSKLANKLDDRNLSYMSDASVSYWIDYINDFHSVLNKYLFEKKLTEKYVDSYSEKQEETITKI